MRIEGYGAKIKTLVNDVTIFDRSIPTVSGHFGANGVPSIAGFQLQGQAANATTAGIGIRVDGAGGASFRDMTMLNLYRGMHLIWCLYSTVSNISMFGVLESYLATGGSFESSISDGSIGNSNCNEIRFTNCKAEMKNANAIGYRIQGAGQAVLSQCVAEGTDGDIAFLIQGHDGTDFVSQRDIRLENCWNEQTGGGHVNTVYKLETTQSTVYISGGRVPTRTGTTPNQMVYIDDTTAFPEVKDNQYIMERLDFVSWNGTTDPWFKNQSRSAGDKNAWIFENNQFHPSTPSLNDNSLWSNAPATSILLRGTNTQMGTAFDTV
jgi:hypothetical protein